MTCEDVSVLKELCHFIYKYGVSSLYMLTKPVYKELTIHKDNNKITEHRALPKGKAELVNQQTDKISQQYIFKLHF
jgi:hypothetical protein